MDVGIPNFVVFEDRRYRGGQPTDDGWNYLKRIGVRTVVKLDPAGQAQDVAAEALGMDIIYVPINTLEQIFTMPSTMAIHCAADALEQPDVFVHCQHGQDRTGLVVGCFRVWHRQWAKDQAYAEMMQYGFHPILLGLLRFWRTKV